MSAMSLLVRVNGEGSRKRVPWVRTNANRAARALLALPSIVPMVVDRLRFSVTLKELAPAIEREIVGGRVVKPLRTTSDQMSEAPMSALFTASYVLEKHIKMQLSFCFVNALSRTSS